MAFIDERIAQVTRRTEASVRVFADQDAVLAAFEAGELDRDVVVVRVQGPRANGMPELHKLTPALRAAHLRRLARPGGADQRRRRGCAAQTRSRSHI